MESLIRLVKIIHNAPPGLRADVLSYNLDPILSLPESLIRMKYGFNPEKDYINFFTEEAKLVHLNHLIGVTQEYICYAVASCLNQLYMMMTEGDDLIAELSLQPLACEIPEILSNSPLPVYLSSLKLLILSKLMEPYYKKPGLSSVDSLRATATRNSATQFLSQNLSLLRLESHLRFVEQPERDFLLQQSQTLMAILLDDSNSFHDCKVQYKRGCKLLIEYIQQNQNS